MILSIVYPIEMKFSQEAIMYVSLHGTSGLETSVLHRRKFKLRTSVTMINELIHLTL